MSVRIKNSQGVYVLALNVCYSISIKTSRFIWLLYPGLYFYFGSARGKTSTSLEKRIVRHYTNQKKIFWHIDHLTSHPNSKILNTYYSTSPKMTECQTLKEFVQKFQYINVIPHFGSSDCKSKCGGHLLFISSNQDRIIEFTRYFQQKNWKDAPFESIF
ncbi:MAG: DUF123 domain-containing protein [Candidatus Hodarchaeota archaeon]